MYDPVAILSGALVGFSLGLIGGGGSILATPLMLYVVGLKPHVAIGTSALAVSANAFVGFGTHARNRHVRWHSAIMFALFGIAGAVIGSTLGKALDGKKLLFLFAILMIVVGMLMLRRGDKRPATLSGERIGLKKAGLTGTVALAVGVLSGFFGIGGGFLIVPGLLFATGMPMIFAIGSSLLSVGTFSLTTAVNYAISDQVEWPVAVKFIIGGVIGGLLGAKLATSLSASKNALNRVFAGFVFAVAIYMLYTNAAAFGVYL
jgi:uncharacterized membrane protein YfcA